MATRSYPVFIALMVLSAPEAILAQAQSPLFITVEVAGRTVSVPGGANVNLVAEAIGSTVTANVTATNRGTASVSVTRLDLTGAPELRLSGVPALPAELTPGQELKFSVSFQAATSRASTAQLVLGFTAATTPPAPPGVPAIVLLSFTGTAPEFGLAYILQNNGNVVSIAEGGTILFPSVQVNSSDVANVLILNQGSGPLEVRSIALTQSGPASEFQILGLPLIPGFVDPGQSARFSIRYTPRQSGAHTARLQIGLVNRTVSFTVQGFSTGPSFSYELLDGPVSAPLQPNQSYALPDTALGSTYSAAIRVTNNGDGDGQVAGINLLGQGFQATDLPFLPLTLAPGSSFFFTLNFAPQQPGRAIGRLRIGNDNFELTAFGLGQRLVYAFNAGGASIAVPPNGPIIFSTINVGQQSSLVFTVENTGTTEAVIPAISTVSAGEFTLSGLPPFPAILPPGGRLPFTISFSPNATGPVTSSLSVGSQTFVLSGVANPPPSFPTYRFEGPGGAIDPFQQVSIGLTLNAPYSLPVSGTLTIGFNSAGFAVDPALQFVTGGRTANFTIPAGSTAAIFPGGSNRIGLQTGTVAGTITIAAGFATSGGIALNSSPPTVLNLTVSAKLPGVLAVEVAPQGNASFIVFVTGFASSRTLTRLDLTFTPTASSKLVAGQFAVDLSSSGAVWFRSGASQSSGGLFTVTVPFQAQGLGTSQNYTGLLESVSATLTNELGTSTPVVHPIR